MALRALSQFVGKIVVKNGTGTLYYTFPLEAELYMPSVQNLDLRGYVPFPRLKQPFEVAYSDDFLAKERNPDKDLLRVTVLALREQGRSYREIAQAVGLHWTRVQQIVKSAGESPSM